MKFCRFPFEPIGLLSSATFIVGADSTYSIIGGTKASTFCFPKLRTKYRGTDAPAYIPAITLCWRCKSTDTADLDSFVPARSTVGAVCGMWVWGPMVVLWSLLWEKSIRQVNRMHWARTACRTREKNPTISHVLSLSKKRCYSSSRLDDAGTGKPTTAAMSRQPHSAHKDRSQGIYKYSKAVQSSADIASTNTIGDQVHLSERGKKNVVERHPKPFSSQQ